MKNNLEKVIITGGAGFIGSNLAEHLFKNGTKEILIIDDFSTGSKKNIEHLKNINIINDRICLLYTSPSPRDGLLSRMPSSA